MATIVPGDILVVGAGPAGSCAAAIAAREGADVFLIDAKTRIGEQPHCGEFVPARLFTEFGLDDSAIIQRVDSMETRILSESEEKGLLFGTELLRRETPSAGFLIDRPRFDRDLARKAAALGATVLCSTSLIRSEGPTWIASSAGEELAFQPKVVVAADGANSRVAKCVDLKAPDLLAGVQCEVPLSGPLSKTIIFLHKKIVGGYAWLFPKGTAANVGLGIVPGSDTSPAALLDQFLLFLRSAGLVRPGRLARTGGVIPVSGLREFLVKDNVVFCGDAAGLTHPITGAGIPQAIVSGEAAGRAAVKAARSGDYSRLAEYADEIAEMYGGVLNHAGSKRMVMRERWAHADFVTLCEETWIGFRGYARRVKSKGRSRSPGHKTSLPCNE